jgi:hypothetical protein
LYILKFPQRYEIPVNGQWLMVNFFHRTFPTRGFIPLPFRTFPTRGFIPLRIIFVTVLQGVKTPCRNVPASVCPVKLPVYEVLRLSSRQF